MANLEQFTADVIKEHEALATAFETKQQQAEAAWAAAEAAADQLTAFRATYGKVLKALVSGGITVAGSMQTPAVKAEG
jgi:hypothetical protein